MLRRYSLAAVLAAAQALMAQGVRPMPRIVEKEGRFALLVDGAPYLILGAQVNNSSAWPAMLPKVWPAIEYLHANTVEMPVYWEQFEPAPGRLDYAVVDRLVSEARAHGVRLVLLWFGSWKNGSGHYMPLWMKRDPARYPRARNAAGGVVDSPSPFAAATLEADKRAFAGLMRHLKETDERRTVIMVQVENEAGTWAAVRDYSAGAQKAFASAAPAALLAALRKDAGLDWRAAFGADADEFFHAWFVARFVGEVAAAGKAEYGLPLYTNAALRDPLEPGPPITYESGGPTDNVLPVWKVAAPALDLLAPDIYQNDAARYLKVLELYGGGGNPLFIPETGSSAGTARFFFAALGHGAIGFAPFGIDYTGYSNATLGAGRVTEQSLEPFALNYRLIGPMMREIARLSFEGRLQAVCERKEEHTQKLSWGPWKAVISYGLPPFGPGRNPPGNAEPAGRALIAQLSSDQFLVAGLFCRVDFEPAAGRREFLRVEEGGFSGETFRPSRIWNGDQADWGLNFGGEPQALRVTLGTF